MITAKQAFEKYGVSRQWLYIKTISKKLSIKKREINGRTVNFYIERQIKDIYSNKHVKA